MLWNYPEAVKDHTFRSIADPKCCYIDGRIDALENYIIELADHISKYSAYYWKELISRIIDVFKLEYNKEPDEIYLKEYHFAD